jgi:hypothetical protein
MKRKYIKLPPELYDGQHSTFHREGKEWSPTVLGLSLEEWLCQEQPGAQLTLEIVEMTDEEHEAIPEM